MNKPSAIIFDFDDTLINAREIINQSLAATLNHFNIDPKLLDNIEMHLSLKDYFYQIFKNDVSQAADVYYQNYDLFSQNLKAFDFAEDVLKFLKSKQIFTSIVSNKSGSRLRKEVIGKFMWGSYFYHIIGSGDAVKDKPSALPAKAALDGANISDYKNVWFIGDSLVDVETAYNLGCKAVLFGKNPPKSQLPVYLSVEDHSSLLNILKEIYG